MWCEEEHACPDCLRQFSRQIKQLQYAADDPGVAVGAEMQGEIRHLRGRLDPARVLMSGFTLEWALDTVE